MEDVDRFFEPAGGLDTVCALGSGEGEELGMAVEVARREWLQVPFLLSKRRWW